MNITETNYENHGYTGLTNLGNTCFLNSCLQVLVHTKELHTIFNSNVRALMQEHATKPEAQLFNEWKRLAELMWSGNGVVKPLKFVQTLHKVAQIKDVEIFTGWAQNDTTEFLRFLLDCFHTTIARPVKVSIKGKPKTDTDQVAIKCFNMLKDVYTKEYSEIYDLFYGISVSEISTSAGTQSLCPEPYIILDLPLTSQNLEECISNYIKPEALTGENAWYNDKTNAKEDAAKRIYFWNFPKILIIALKRFIVNGRHIYRNNSLIHYPLTNLDLSKYVEGYNAAAHNYELYGVSNHMGTPNGGHYTSYVKTDKGWIHYNDESLSSIHESQVISPHSYCLFYRRI
jgi:ubiquitin C-terminal hydrolase